MKQQRVWILVAVGGVCIIIGALLMQMYTIYRYKKEVRQYYSGSAEDQKILKEYCFPFPFFREKIKNLSKPDRKAIEGIMSGYVFRYEGKQGDLTIDTYVYFPVPLHYGMIDVLFDADGNFAGFGESTPCYNIY